MAKTEVELENSIREMEQRREEAMVAMGKVRTLLGKADERKAAQPQALRWNHILDNLERTLDYTRAKLTAYDYDLHVYRQELASLQQKRAEPPVPRPDMDGLTDLERSLLEEIIIPENFQALAERICSVPIDEIGRMTVQEVDELSSRIAGSVSVETPPSDVEALPKKSRLDERIERAQQRRRELEGKRTHAHVPTLLERRRKQQTRNALVKLIVGQTHVMNIEEVESILDMQRTIAQAPNATEAERKLMGLIDSRVSLLQERLHELKQKQVRDLARRQLQQPQEPL